MPVIKITKLLTFFVLVFFIFYFLFQYWPVVIHVEGLYPENSFSIKMPLKDKKRLEYFFRYVYFLEAWAYTSIGHKPLSVCQYVKPTAQIYKAITSPHLKLNLRDAFWPPDFHEICYLLNPEQFKIHLGCKTLKKYLKQFRKSRFTFLTYNIQDSVCMVFVDKKKLQMTIQCYSEDFQQVFDLLNMKLEDLQDDKKVCLFLKNLKSEFLYGILLGYGRNNSRAFEKYNNFDENSMESMWLGELEKWIEQIDEKDRSFIPWDLSDLFYPRFSCIPNSKETQELIRIYKEDRNEIISYYEGRDIVEATLSFFNDRL